MLKNRPAATVRWEGLILVDVYRHDRPGGVPIERIHRYTFPNLITDLGLNALRGALGNLGDPHPTYLAYGAGAGTPAISDVKLEAEFGRTAIQIAQATGTGILTTQTTIHSVEGNQFTIEELGWFAQAVDLVDDGILIARVNFTHTKNELESILVTRQDTIARSP